jgi:hypothetical protein
MSARLGAPARLIWSLTGSSLGTTIAASGNSGAWPSQPYQPSQLNAMTPVDLRDVEDLWITAMCASLAGTTPTLTVSLNQFDDGGNAWKQAALAAVSAAGIAGGQQLALGKHGAAGGNYSVFSAWGQVAWVVAGAGATFTGVDISLWAR